jgi:catechol 2,3-dioxygenase
MPDASTRPTMVGHVHLKVHDVERAIDFYTSVLDLDIEERHARFAFLSFGERHHDVALQEVDRQTDGPPSSRSVGLYHAAFEVESSDALATIYDRLLERAVDVSPVDHGISKALYFADPDSNGLEVYLDTRTENDIHEWDGTNERFDPREL